MKRRMVLGLSALLLSLTAVAPAGAAAATTICRMDYTLKGWSAFYKTSRGSGTITCDNGQTARAKISVTGGGLTAGKSEIRDGHGQFSEVARHQGAVRHLRRRDRRRRRRQVVRGAGPHQGRGLPGPGRHGDGHGARRELRQVHDHSSGDRRGRHTPSRAAAAFFKRLALLLFFFLPRSARIMTTAKIQGSRTFLWGLALLAAAWAAAGQPPSAAGEESPDQALARLDARLESQPDDLEALAERARLRDAKGLPMDGLPRPPGDPAAAPRRCRRGAPRR